MVYVIIILTILCLFLVGLLFYNSKKLTNFATIKEIKEQCLELTRQNAFLKKEQESLNKAINSANLELGKKTAEWNGKEQLCQKAFELYCTKLEKYYNDKEAEYNLACENLSKSYEIIQENVIQEKNSLDNLVNLRSAAQRALVQEEKTKADQSYYKLEIPPTAQNDIQLLNGIKERLSIQRAIGKLIWETYYRPVAKEKFPKIVGKPLAAGVYKITNTLTNSCYIGQAVDIVKRWGDHCKAAIVEGTKNKLYNAIREYGLENFTFEVLEECEPEHLNERERFFIQMYDSYNYGYNSTQGGS